LFHEFLNSAYPEHVAGLVVELALGDISLSANACNNFSFSPNFFPGQQCAFAGMTVAMDGATPATP
jgi:hypothetical protein